MNRLVEQQFGLNVSAEWDFIYDEGTPTERIITRKNTFKQDGLNLILLS